MTGIGVFFYGLECVLGGAVTQDDYRSLTQGARARARSSPPARFISLPKRLPENLNLI
jgi:hypothetical protein